MFILTTVGVDPEICISGARRIVDDSITEGKKIAETLARLGHRCQVTVAARVLLVRSAAAALAHAGALSSRFLHSFLSHSYLVLLLFFSRCFFAQKKKKSIPYSIVLPSLKKVSKKSILRISKSRFWCFFSQNLDFENSYQCLMN